MDELLQKAFQRREQLRAELEALDLFIASYSSIRESPDAGGLSLESTSDRRRSRAARVEAINSAMAAAERMILDEGRPLTRSELLERLQAAGHKIEGGDRSKVLGTNLWRSGKFWNVKGVGYWPKVSPLPQQYAGMERRRSMLSA